LSFGTGWVGGRKELILEQVVEITEAGQEALENSINEVAVDGMLMWEIEECWGEMPDIEQLQALDQTAANRVLGAMRRIREQVQTLEAQRSAEKRLIEDLFEQKVSPLMRQYDFLQERYRPLFERVVEESGKSTVKMLWGSLKRKIQTFKGRFVEGMETRAVEIAKELGYADLVKPEQVIPESINWGDFKKLLEFRMVKEFAPDTEHEGKYIETGKEKVSVILKPTGELIDFVEAEQSGGELEIKFE
jgi:hypothetical protein